ncbi:glycosyltransferase family 39 protein [Dactylosporangium sp. NPDC048998]|uniref:glycosyltransferase family 39 protein n=1 Tax=Dactylosporangium sp. NPDC048998 TaxID=3363976 RepID=UPI00371E2842
MTTTTLPSPPRSAAARPRHEAPAARPAWQRPALAALLLLTAVLYLWRLADSGTANGFYAAAVQAGTQSWKALLFGSLDAGNVITVDKPPASLWVMGLSGRIFGFNSWSLLVPQALEGVAAVALLYATVKRHFGAAAGLFAGAAFALTPVAVLMFRFDNPDALLVLLLVAGAYCTTRAVEKASPLWLSLAATALGFAFLTKMLQGLLVLPAFALAYLIAAPTTFARRFVHLLTAGATLVVSAGWYVALVALWPAGSRPYIGGSTDNSLLELALGYNGLGRILGGDGNRGGGGGGGGMRNTAFGGGAGLTRLFGDSMGSEISWLLPAALIALVAGLWFTRRAPRTDAIRAALVLWGGWLLVSGIVFSYMSGTIHPYYTVALAPAIAALVAIGARELWRARAATPARLVLAAMVFATAAWDFTLLSRDASWTPWLRWSVLIAGGAAAVAVAALAGITETNPALTTTAPTGPAGPRTAVASTARTGTAGDGTAGDGTAGDGTNTAGVSTVATGAGTAAMRTAAPRSHAAGAGAGLGFGRRLAVVVALAAVLAGFAGTGAWALATASQPHAGAIPSSGPASSAMGFGGRGFGGGMGGFGGAGESGSGQELTALLKATTTKWAAATNGDQSAAELELATGKSVIAIGGWDGSDPAPTLAQFQAAVSRGEVAYYVSGGRGGMGGGRGEIATWVAEHYTAETVGNTTVYKLTK